MSAADSATISAQSRAFGRIRRQALLTIIRQGLQKARLRIFVFLSVSAVFWVGLYILFFQGFLFLVTNLNHENTRAQAVSGVFNVFFLALLVMLTFSSGIILYSTIYRSEEVSFLLTTPARPERILLHKLQEAVLFSSWGFLLLGTPLLIAYGAASGAPWYYHLMLAPFMISFVITPTSLGAIGCMVLVRLMPTVRLHALLGAGLILVLLGVGSIYWLAGAFGEAAMTPDWFQDMIHRLRYSEQRILPSWWLSSGLLEAAHPAKNQPMESLLESVKFLGVLLANALFFQMIAQAVAARWLRPGFSGLQGVGRVRRRARASWPDRWSQWICRPLPRISRGMLIKDLRLFRRDPVQWGQFAIFFSLLTLYFVNIRRFQQGEYFEAWTPLLGFVNVAVVGLILSTFTTRFIYPLISLEGRRIWILGTLPIDRGAVLWGKFFLSCLGSLPACSALILLSDLMLGILVSSPLQSLIHQLVCWTLCFGLSGLAVGLGARFPDLSEPSPSKIAAGFGGTLNLVLSAALIIVVVLLAGAPTIAWAAGKEMETGGIWLLGLGPWWAALVGVIAAILLGAAAAALPMRVGLKAFRKMEY